MKSERRHELEHNALAIWLDHAITSSKPHINKILGAALTVVLIFCAIVLLNRYSDSATAKSWNSLFQSLSSNPMLAETKKAPELTEIAKSQPTSEVGQIAAVIAADRALDLGCNLLFENKAKANEEINKAIDDYKIVVRSPADAGLQQRALYGLARAQEASGNIVDAIATYKRLEVWPEGPYAKFAQDRVADLQSKGTEEFYDRFRGYEPNPPKSASGEKPAFDVDSLLMPKDDKTDMKSSFDLNPDSLKPTQEEPKAEGETKPEANKPVETKPAETQPAETPVEEKKPDAAPAEEKKPEESAKPEETPAAPAQETPAAPADQNTAPPATEAK